VPGLLATIALRIITAKLDTSVGVPGPHGLAVRFELIRPRAKARLSRNVHRIRIQHS
jgi:hypothetical protein